MERKLLRNLIALNLLFGIVVLSCARANPVMLNVEQKSPIMSNVKATPTPISSSSPQEQPCGIANNQPTPTSQTSSPKRTDEMTVENSRAFIKGMDRDCDGINDYDDNCRNLYNPNQEDKNKNGIGDACEPKRKLKVKKRKS